MSRAVRRFHHLRLWAVLSLFAAITGCGSIWVDIDAPAAAAQGDMISVDVTHEFDGDIGFDGEDSTATLVFAAGVPNGWTPKPTGTWSGTLGGNPVNLPVSLIGGPPASNIIEILEQEEGPIPPDELAIIEQGLCDVTPPPAPVGIDLFWFETGPLPSVDTIEGDGGTVTLGFNVGGSPGTAEIGFVHAYFSTEEETIGEPPEPVTLTACIWFLDPDSSEQDELFPDLILATIEVLQGVVRQASDIPATRDAGLLLLALLLAAAGWAIGRNRLS